MANARELLSFPLRNGYIESRQTGSHLVLKHTERKTVVVPVHRGKDLPKGLFLRILKDATLLLKTFAKVEVDVLSSVKFRPATTHPTVISLQSCAKISI